MVSDAVILGASRTRTGLLLGALALVPAVQMGGIVIAEAVWRAGLEPGEVDEVIIVNALADRERR